MCVENGEIPTRAICRNDNLTLYVYGEPTSCSATPSSSASYVTKCSGSQKYDVVCVDGSTTTTQMGSTDECNFVQMEEVLYATDKCMKRVAESTYSQMYVCNSNNEAEEHTWSNSDSCEGSANTILSMSQYAILYDVNQIGWNCRGTKSNDDCAISNVLVYVAGDTCDTELYQEYFILNDVCTYSAGYDMWLSSTCSDETITIGLYDQDDCSQSVNSYSWIDGCGETTVQGYHTEGYYTKFSITCSASGNLLALSQIWAVLFFFTFFVSS